MSSKRAWFALAAAMEAFFILVAALMSSHAVWATEITQKRIDKWEPVVREFEVKDAKAVPATGGVVFVGSSSIRLWNLSKSFADDPPLNRGFGGARITDVNYFADRLVLKHKPRTIVFYAGDNDIAAGIPATEVSEDFAQFCKLVHAELPKTKIVFISIKPSPKRWHLVEVQKLANDLICRHCERDERLVHLDVWTPMLNTDGQPRKELFGKDMLHLNNAGYELWSDLVKPLLAQ